MDGTIWRGEARGRLDFLGGVADSSGSMVLQMPLGVTTRVEIAGGATSNAFLFASESERKPFTLPSTVLRAVLRREASLWRGELEEMGAPAWTHLVLGAFGLFCRETRWWPDVPLRFRVTSDVPRPCGLASGAALQVATLRALEGAAGGPLPAKRLAFLSHEAQLIVGGRGTLSAHLACAWGAPGLLLPIALRPDWHGESVPLPGGVIAAAWPVGVSPSTADSPFVAARAAARMGGKILEAAHGKPPFLTDFQPSQLPSDLPLALSGEEFQAQWKGEDSVPDVEATRTYPVCAATRFAVEENFRCRLTHQLLGQSAHRGTMPLVGEFLFQSHAGYKAMGLSSPEADAMVEAIRTRGAARGFYGARVAGNTASGAVAVLLEERALPELELLRSQFPSSGAIVR